MTHDTRYDTRASKSEKILAILRAHLGQDLSNLTCLDVGCSNGAISVRTAGSFKRTIGIDLDAPAIAQAASEHQSDQMIFALASGHAIPFEDNSFDLIICAQVYEHSTDQPALAREVWRVLRPGGIVFFSGPNRLKIMEEHYWLPFLSWLPRPLANRYMQLFKRGKVYDAYPLTYWQIRRLWKPFRVIDYTIQILRDPAKFSMSGRLRRFTWLGKLPAGLFNLLQPVLPNYNWVLEKRN